MFKQTVFTIDPSGCTDADDGFSIWRDKDTTHLMIHIADPTEFMDDDLFALILQRAQTTYPFGQPPIHLFPEDILRKASLIDGQKNAISVHATFNADLQLHNACIEYLKIDCRNENRFTYEQAAEAANVMEFELGLSLARSLKDARQHVNIPTLVIPYMENGVIIMKPDEPRVKAMKEMIAEFAILANSVFAKGLSDRNLFLRSVKIDKDLATNGEMSLQILVENSITANYTVDKLTHDIVTGDLYTHATSPLRRASDCIVHMLLKDQSQMQSQSRIGFTPTLLKQWAAHLTVKSREFKQEQFKGIKTATLKWIQAHVPVDITVVIVSYKKGFLNMLITEVNGMNVNISYTLRGTCAPPQPPGSLNLTLTKVILHGGKYDEGTLPELDEKMKSLP